MMLCSRHDPPRCPSPTSSGCAATSFPELAQEIRDRLIECCSMTGGHIGASLGVVELSIALLYEFDSPR